MENDPRLTNLMTYTTFHIGVYISLITAFIASSYLAEKICIYLLQYSSACVLLAGIFGGVIGSNIQEFKTYGEMQNAKLKAFGVIPMPNLKRCAHLEHLFFWAGVLPIAVLFIFGGTDALLK